MQVSTSRQLWWWGIAAAVLAFALWRLGTVLTPFLIGAGIAYVLDPVADRLERMGLSRTLAVAAITVFALLLFAAVLLVVVPLLVRQTAQLVEMAPRLLDQVQGWLTARFPQAFPEGGTLGSALSQFGAQFSQQGGALLTTVLSSVTTVIGVVALFVIVPVVAFYLLLDWDRMIARIDRLLPREHAATIRGLAAQIDDSLSGFLRGQGLVTLILATLYSVGLLAIGLPFGLVIGIAAAVLSIIPFVGVAVGGITSIAVAAFTWWDQPLWIGVTAGIFAIGQVVEGNYLQPKIIGSHVGLHPVCLMVALSVFGSLFGFVGLVVAVPLGAVMGVLTRFFVERYKESAMYTGVEVPPPPAAPTLIELVPRGTVGNARASALAAREAAVADVKVQQARDEAATAAREAAEKDGASVAVASVRIARPGAQGALAHQRGDGPEVRTWGGKTPDGTDPDA